MASKHDGAASYSNIVTISESPLVPGVLWVGTNDGNLQVSRDGGATWKNVVGNVKGVPKETHVSRVEASHFDAGTCYVSFDGHRSDDHKPYVFKTTDFGQTWTSMSSNLPEGNVNVIREDPKNRNLLYLGTEYAFFVSLNGGQEWKRFMTGLPTVRIDDILVHPRDNDLIVATHGRSIWIIDDITPLQQLSDDVHDGEAHLFDIRPATAWANDIQQAILVEGAKHFRGPTRAGHGDQLLAEERRVRRRDDHDHRHHGPRDQDHRGHEEGRAESRPVGPAAECSAGSRTRKGRSRATGRSSRRVNSRLQPRNRPRPAQPGQAAQAGRGQQPAPTTVPVTQPQRDEAGAAASRRAVPPGSYLVKVMIGDKVIGQKTVVVEADSMQ